MLFYPYISDVSRNIGLELFGSVLDALTGVFHVLAEAMSGFAARRGETYERGEE